MVGWYNYLTDWVAWMKMVMTGAINKFFELLPQQLPPESVWKALSIIIIFCGVLWIITLLFFWHSDNDE